MGINMQAKEIRTSNQLIEAIRQLWEARSIRRLREWLKGLETEEDFYRLIQLADQADLDDYGNFFATQAYKQLGTLRSFAWHCARLSDTGKSLEAEERMRGRLQNYAANSYTGEELAAAHSLLLKVFCELNRLPEAKEQLRKIEEARGMVWPDEEGYYYIHSGEWEKAEQVLKSALEKEDVERSSYTRPLYAELLSMTGRQTDSLAVLQEGEETAPENWGYRIEQVSRLYHLGRYNDAISLMKEINEKNPFHLRRNYFVYLTAASLYKLEQWDELNDWISVHQQILKSTLYGKTDIRRDEKVKQLKLTPKVQKMNYCVPASLSLMLEAFGMEIGQDEIASHVFDVTGSKLRTTLTYMESLGLEARYFKGTVDLYKKFIDAGVPVLLSMMIENSAHVQVVIGYDDRLQGLIIQDPNDQAPFLLSYAEVKSVYKLTDSLSVAFVKKEQNQLLELLDDREHRFFSELYAFLDEAEKGESEAFLEFLDSHTEERFAAVVGVATLFTDRAQALHSKWLERLQREFGKEDEEVALLAAHMHFQKRQLPEALAYLAYVDEKRSPYALFLKGAVLMDRDAHEQAIPMLKKSIELDHYQPEAYSHLARCYLETGKSYQAYKWSSIALEQLPSDVFAQVTHSLIQYESGAYEKALERFRKLSEEHPDDGYFIYEIGRCLQQLGDEEQAIAAFSRAIEIDPALPYSYLRIAEIHMEAEAWQKAENIINKGLEKAETADVLHIYRGHIAMERKRFKEAETEYRKALELDPEDLFAVTHIAHMLIKQERFDEAGEWIGQYTEKGDAGYFIRTASMLWEEWPEYAEKEQAVLLLEQGLENAEREGFHDIAGQYAEFGEDPFFRHRVLKKFKDLRETGPDEVLLCMEGSLHEETENNRFARKLYLQAAEKADYPLAHYRLGLLEEKRGRYEEAINHHLRCAELDPGFTAAYGGLMHDYTALENKERALAAAMIVLENDPLELDLGELFRLADTEEAVSAISKRVEEISEKVPEEWLLVVKAHCAEKEGRLKEAENLFVQAKAVNGAYRSRFEHVEFCERRGDFKRAAVLLEEMIADYPDLVGLYEKYIGILGEVGKTNEISKRLKQKLSGENLAIAKTYCADFLALWFEQFEQEEPKGLIAKLRHNARSLKIISNIITLYEDAIKQLPENELPVTRLAGLYMSREMAKEAVDELKPFVERTGNFEAALLQVQATLQLADQEESYKIARSAAVQARKLHEQRPFDTRLLLARGEALYAIGEFEKTVAQYEQLIHLEPYNTEGYARLMHLLAEQRPQEVKGFEARLPEELKDHEWIRLNLGMVYVEVKEGLIAREILVSLIQDEPDYLPTYYELARAEMLLGNKGAAINHLRYLADKEEGRHYIVSADEDPLFESIMEEIHDLIGEFV
ncbi:tetratricopeptide repeat protein [Planococcus sp. N028]|uniref:Tetratricopeptide repeat protein n=1 Tax=Planococcus shixiaomingii TaxID=3058393 RepID=A0ABT8N376_9BACL|nr:tetratricopeptide repeat protein [Planococcus sp. N028]MDN7242149.1 tetratricopeptide repeat protein [Planococcus sp. N028]